MLVEKLKKSKKKTALTIFFKLWQRIGAMNRWQLEYQSGDYMGDDDFDCLILSRMRKYSLNTYLFLKIGNGNYGNVHPSVKHFC